MLGWSSVRIEVVRRRSRKRGRGALEIILSISLQILIEPSCRWIKLTLVLPKVTTLILVSIICDMRGILHGRYVSHREMLLITTLHWLVVKSVIVGCG